MEKIYENKTEQTNTQQTDLQQSHTQATSQDQIDWAGGQSTNCTSIQTSLPSFLSQQLGKHNLSSTDTDGISITSDMESQLLNTPVGSQTNEDKIEFSESERKEIKRFKLSGAATKKLKRLIGIGKDYFVAKKELMDMARTRALSRPLDSLTVQENQTTGTTKRVRSNNTTPESQPAAKKTKQVWRDRVAEERVAILHQDHPTLTLENDQLPRIKQAILDAVLSIPEDGPQIRFTGSHFKTGWLAIDCADSITRDWLIEITPHLRPWAGAGLKAVMGELVPKVKVCQAYIPDDTSGEQLSTEVVLGRICKMNKGIKAQNWRVLSIDTAGSKGHLWTFAIDCEESLSALKKMDMKPYFGFGRIEVREKGIKPTQKPTQSTKPIAGPSKDKRADIKGKPKRPVRPSESSKQGMTDTAGKPNTTKLTKGTQRTSGNKPDGAKPKTNEQKALVLKDEKSTSK